MSPDFGFAIPPAGPVGSGPESRRTPDYFSAATTVNLAVMPEAIWPSVLQTTS